MAAAVYAASGAYCAQAQAGNDNSALGQFEKSVQPPPSKPADASSREDREHQGDDDFGTSLLRALLSPDDGSNQGSSRDASPPGISSAQRLAADTDPAVRRNDGDILIPYVRYDFFRQSVATNVSANDHRLEAGYGSYAVMLEHYVFREQIPNATLSIDRQMLLLRMSSDRNLEIDIGLGQTVISGAQRTTLGSISLPIKVALNDNVALEFRPTKADTMDDYEAALHWGGQYGSLKIGYRTLVGRGASLSGPFAGFAVYY